jgi:hypothetical protein
MPYNDALIIEWLTQAHQTPLLTEREREASGRAGRDDDSRLPGLHAQPHREDTSDRGLR